MHDASLADAPQLVRAAGAAAALALENQRLSAELRARIEELRASRARIVEAGDTERRRLERDLHDGAQARLVALAMKLRLARRKADGDVARAARRVLGRPPGEPRRAARAGARHPPGGADGPRPGSGSAQPGRPRAAAGRDRGRPAGGPAPAVATALYFVVAEALTNVAKYASASEATVRVRREGASVVAEISDDGVGGARLDAGSGLRGLTDRVAALDGRLELDSPPGAGTRLRVEIP